MKKKIFAIIMISVHILHIHIQSFISFNWEGKKNLNQLDQGFAHVNIWVWKSFTLMFWNVIVKSQNCYVVFNICNNN